GDVRLVVRPGDHVAAGDVEVVLEAEGDRHGRERLLDRPVVGVDGGDPGGEPGRQVDDLVAGLEHAARDLAGVAAVVVEGGVGGLLRADDVLDGEAHVRQVAVGGDVHVLQVVQQGGALVPGRVLRPGHH